MCDYSLMSLPNRLATEGEQLIVYRFPTGSVGFASPVDANQAMEERKTRPLWRRVFDALAGKDKCSVPAVCIPPSARLMFHGIAGGFQRQHQLACEEEAMFVQLSAEPYSYRDAVCFGNGHLVRLQDLPIGQSATVVRMAGEETPEEIGMKPAVA